MRAGALVLPLLAVGCSAPSRPGEPGSTPGRTAQRLRAALAEGGTAFAECFTPGRASTAAAWFASWRAMASVTLSDTPVGLAVATVIGTEPHQATFRFRIGYRGDRIAEATALAGEPIWFRTAVGARSEAGVAVVTVPEAAAETWVVAARQARDRLIEVLGAGVPPGDLVVELPADVSAFLRRSPTRMDPATAAFTHDAADSGPRVVLNPSVVGSFDAVDRAGLLTHEGVHALLRTPQSPAPLVLVEGLAEWASVPVWPAARRANEAALAGLDAVAVPADAEFRAGGVGEAVAYASSEVVVAGCVRRWGVETVTGWIAGEGPAPSETDLRRVGAAELTRRR